MACCGVVACRQGQESARDFRERLGPLDSLVRWTCPAILGHVSLTGLRDAIQHGLAGLPQQTYEFGHVPRIDGDDGSPAPRVVALVDEFHHLLDAGRAILRNVDLNSIMGTGSSDDSSTPWQAATIIGIGGSEHTDCPAEAEHEQRLVTDSVERLEQDVNELLAIYEAYGLVRV